MSIRWCKEAKDRGLMRVTQGHRHWYLQDTETDQIYMRIEFREANRDRPSGWLYKMYYPPTMGNRICIRRHHTEGEAKLAAEAWWKENRVQHLKVWEDYNK